MTRTTLALGMAALVALAACSHDATGPLQVGSRLVIASGDAGADGVVRGIVAGDLLDRVPTDTSYLNHERIANARVDVFHETRSDSAGGLPVVVTLDYIGSVVTDTEGRFELINVPANFYYRLEVTPPPASAYAPGTSGSVAYTSGAGQAIVYLYRRPAVTGTADAIVAQRVPGGVRVTNTSDRTVAFHVRNPNWLGLLALCETPDATCARLRPGAVIMVRNDEIHGYDSAGPLVFDWWRVDAVGSGYAAGEVHTRAVE